MITRKSVLNSRSQPNKFPASINNNEMQFQLLLGMQSHLSARLFCFSSLVLLKDYHYGQLWVVISEDMNRGMKTAAFKVAL